MYEEEDWDAEISNKPTTHITNAPLTVATPQVQLSSSSFSYSNNSEARKPFSFGRGRFSQHEREKSEDSKPFDTNRSYGFYNRSSTSGYDRNNNSSSYNKSSYSSFGSNNSSYDRPRSDSAKRSFESTNEFASTEPTKVLPKIDWNAVRSQPLQNLSKFKDHPAVVKDFYDEDPEIKAMTREEVKEFRKQNFNITVDVFKKEKPISLSGAKAFVEDTRTPEQIEDYLFETIPKPQNPKTPKPLKREIK